LIPIQHIKEVVAEQPLYFTSTSDPMNRYFLICFLLVNAGCKKNPGSGPTQPATPFRLLSLQVTGAHPPAYYSVAVNPEISISFSAPVDHSSVIQNISLKDDAGVETALSSAFSHNDSTVTLTASAALKPIQKYHLKISSGLQSQSKLDLPADTSLALVTAIDSADKFPRITDSALLTLVEQQTFKYFYDFGHPVSGLARERNSSGDVVTTGGSGFGVMALLVGIQRNFISKTEALTRLTQIVTFLTDKAQRYHGAFPHWMNGVTGATVPFSAQDDGADLVETSYMLQGLLCARQFFNGSSPEEIALRTNINSIWQDVDWQWFRQNDQNVLYWHWSPDMNWAINMKISGWNETLIVYALAASGNNPIPKIVYDNGWALNGSIKNGNSYFGVQLPLGPPLGGPLFFAHYSFLGINPKGLSDAYADYWTQNTAHTQINYNYCVANPKGYNGYSRLCWGLTAGDDNITGYSAHSPTNDLGIISPTAAISSLPYSPTESLNALKFFYYTLGDKLWGPYGFTDAFNLSDPWFASSYLAIDQGAEIVMIENYRSGLLWNLFMSCPEIKTGMKSLGFQSPQWN
jgi:hypothetical protein